MGLKKSGSSSSLLKRKRELSKKYYHTGKGQKTAARYYLKNRKRIIEYGRKQKEKNPIPGIFGALKQRGETKGMGFALDKLEFREWWNRIPNSCHYCNIPLADYKKIKEGLLSYAGADSFLRKIQTGFPGSRRSIGAKCNRMTVDRKDNSGGYSIKNICKACWLCNSIKGVLFSETLMKIIGPFIMGEIRRKLNI